MQRFFLQTKPAQGYKQDLVFGIKRVLEAAK